jgi:hypothetical protein
MLLGHGNNGIRADFSRAISCQNDEFFAHFA